jgi:hypothetical protein
VRSPRPGPFRGAPSKRRGLMRNRSETSHVKWRTNVPPKAGRSDILGRFREIVSDPINVLIERVPQAGFVEDNLVCLHNGNRVPYSGHDAYYQRFSDILVINRGVHEPVEEFAFQECLKALPPCPSMRELGAYWAHYSTWLKKIRPNATVTMVEPDPANLSVGLSKVSRRLHAGLCRKRPLRGGCLP